MKKTQDLYTISAMLSTLPCTQCGFNKYDQRWVGNDEVLCDSCYSKLGEPDGLTPLQSAVRQALVLLEDPLPRRNAVRAREILMEAISYE